MERIIAATRKLLEEHTFEQLSIQEIAREARSSVGVFYSRFPDKQALLEHLDVLYAQELMQAVDELTKDWQVAAPSLAEKIDTATRWLVRFHRAHRGLIRTLVLHARRVPGGTFHERTRRTLDHASTLLTALETEGRSSLGVPQRSVSQLAFVTVLATIREHVLFPEGPASLAPIDDELLVEMVRRLWWFALTGQEWRLE